MLTGLEAGFDASLPLLALYLLALASCLYTLLAVFAVRRAFPRENRGAAPKIAPSVTVLKPLYGAEPGLREHLLSFCRQDYAGPVRIVFGVHSAADPAAAVARRIVEAVRAGEIAGAPAGLTAELVIDPARHGGNGKVDSLINMSRAIVGEVVVLADSDIIVAPDYLNRLTAALEGEGVGAVTCLYRGVAMTGLWARLCAMGVDYAFLPNVATGLALNMAKPCIGATIALRREVLDGIGGFAPLKDQLADDFVLGALVREHGFKVAVADFVVRHAHGERHFSDLWRQEIRWARTIRSIDPGGYFGTLVTHPVGWGLLAFACHPFAPVSTALLVAGLLCRRLLQGAVDARFAGEAQPQALLPLRDLLGFLVFWGSFWPGHLRWRGKNFDLRDDGVMTPVEGERAEAAG
ncbi:ceramide glucosyltransferase [Rhodoblastus acidophilus]|uniref:bacteriohopanetetrol glucosamine biosynthesis glycosyltransferase HpnI n=1 Tax=Rhodoblastus acidophilus TaxID=1074 RepID=UPI0022247E5B|nr:bacteriohopanetetrol glucosamine biosynthesis glycosyltransferase HpnI [Rhodoblastus acidophilus]MCW2286433.1 ceramide glucosyltransferase [Rhodoblastus acidophilus]MCW2335282.1 ceramide glucosyltransferase [Rhodoblastus acidophilus]